MISGVHSICMWELTGGFVFGIMNWFKIILSMLL